MSDLIEKDISHELWREYEWEYPQDDDFVLRTYTINKPARLFYRPNGTTHRVVDTNGIVHCVPAPGFMGCALRWRNPSDIAPVQF